MKTLFNLEKTEKLTIHSYKSKFDKIGYEFDEVTVPELDMGLTIKIYQKNINSKKSIYVVPWVRPLQFSPEFVLSNYPRLNIPKKIRNVPEEKRIEKLLELCSDKNLYFLVILPNPHSSYYWLGKYTDIPLEHWKLTYRKTSTIQDRIYLSNGNPYFEFGNLTKLQEKLNKIFLI